MRDVREELNSLDTSQDGESLGLPLVYDLVYGEFAERARLQEALDIRREVEVAEVLETLVLVGLPELKS